MSRKSSAASPCRSFWWSRISPPSPSTRGWPRRRGEATPPRVISSIVLFQRGKRSSRAAGSWTDDVLLLLLRRLSRYQQFKDFQRRILVATNLFGRGMDIERVNIVFNYDMPEDSDTYLHRVRMQKLSFYHGRTCMKSIISKTQTLVPRSGRLIIIIIIIRLLFSSKITNCPNLQFRSSVWT